MATIGRARSSALIVLLAACSTVESRRESAPTFQGTTARSLGDFEGCFSNAVADQNQVRFLPRANGGTYSAVVGVYQNAVPWIVDVDDLGTSRQVTVHAIGSIWGPDKKMTRIVQTCM